MKQPHLLFAALTLFGSVLGAQAAAPTPLYRAAPIAPVVDGVVWESGNWTPHLEAGAKGDSWGNHRAVVTLDGASGDVVAVTIPWRRHDANPAAKAVVVIDAATGIPVNSLARRVEPASGEVLFQPSAGSEEYFVYYMPWTSGGGYYPKVSYPASMHPSDTAWTRHAGSLDPATLPRARTTAIQSVDDFHSFFPMEVAATPEETARFLADAGGWAAVVEPRDRPVRMRTAVPAHWAGRPSLTTLESQALRGESFSFQVALVAGAEPLDSLEIRFEGFPDALARALTCYNCGGIDENGRRFSKVITVPAGRVQPLWLGWLVADDQAAGPVRGRVVIQPRHQPAKSVSVRIVVQPEMATNHGYDQPELMTRLSWLNSTVGTDPDFVISPFTPVTVAGHDLGILGRRITLGRHGLPDAIESYFTPELTTLSEHPEPVLAAPVDLEVVIAGAVEQLKDDPFVVEQPARGVATWQVERRSERIAMRIVGRLEYDGMLDYRIRVTALEALAIEDIRLPVRLAEDAATYMLGLGAPGGRRPDGVDWRWKVENHQEGVWLGAVNKGLQYVLRDDDYVRPLNTNFYQNQPLRMPAAWFNAGQGGIRIETAAETVVATNYSGPRQMAAGDTLQFNIRFLLTPVKTIDTGNHFRTRFVHKYVPVDSVQAWGGTVVNIHHANAINPYINYPFFNLEAQTAYIEEAHAKGIKVKLYDTIRELTYRAHELFALRSLGDEILNDGEGGGHSWLQEHLGDGYHAAWHAWTVDDAAILDKGTSRWTNYYIEGLSWLASHQEIDGLYLDDIAFSRETVKRMISVLHAARDEVVIDLHSANQFNPRDGHINSAMLYMEQFPFISRLWFGEYFDYGANPDYWMTEVSGLPFGLMGEMLQDGGHPYRGMLYGMTARLYGDVDPRPVWRMMDDFGIDESRMLGYWLPSPPVETGDPRILATTYQRDGRVLIALASWSDEDVTIGLTLSPELSARWSGARARTPAVEGLQVAATVDLARLVIPANQGLWVVLEPAP